MFFSPQNLTWKTRFWSCWPPSWSTKKRPKNRVHKNQNRAKGYCLIFYELLDPTRPYIFSFCLSQVGLDFSIICIQKIPRGHKHHAQRCAEGPGPDPLILPYQIIFLLHDLNLPHPLEWCWSWSSNTLGGPTLWKRPWCWERLKAGGEGGDRRWDGWMASLAQWTWVWANSGRQQRTGKPGILQFMGSQRVRYNLATEHWHPLEYCSKVIWSVPRLMLLLIVSFLWHNKRTIFGLSPQFLTQSS